MQCRIEGIGWADIALNIVLQRWMDVPDKINNIFLIIDLCFLKNKVS